MKKLGFIVLILLVSIYLFGCGKKQQALEDMQEPMSIEALSNANLQQQGASVPTNQAEQKATDVISKPSVETSAVGVKLESMPPSGPYKPTIEEIQTALKNANFYAGNVDGKKGPKTKKAIEEFQKANGLKADGKVGPKTWSLLGKYLVVEQVVEQGKKR